MFVCMFADIGPTYVNDMCIYVCIYVCLHYVYVCMVLCRYVCLKTFLCLYETPLLIVL